MAWLQIAFQSKCLRREVPLNIWIPADSEGAAPGQGGFKTLYLLHGYGGNQTSYLTESPIKQISEEFGIAVVLPAGENDFYLDREEDGARCGEYVGKELVEFTRALLPCLSRRREDTLIGGFSMGAYGSFINGLRYPHTFGHVIVNSTSLCGFFQESAREAEQNGVNRFHINKGFYELVFGPLEQVEKSDRNPMTLVKKLQKKREEFPDLFLSVGYNDELCFAMRNLVSELRACGVPVTYREYPGTHETSVCNHSLREGLIRLFGDPQKEKNMFWVDNEPVKL